MNWNWRALDRVRRAGAAAAGWKTCAPFPWVFGWMQSRHAVPAWFGVGYALEQFAAQGQRAGAATERHGRRIPAVFRHDPQCRDSPWRRQTSPSRTLYASLVDDVALRESVYRHAGGRVSSRQTHDPADSPASRSCWSAILCLSRSIRLRNPYVDPMSLIQVELLRRKRSGEQSAELDYAIGATMNGIAAGLHNTG